MESVLDLGKEDSLFSSYLDVLENKERQTKTERILRDEENRRRTKRIYELHKRQSRDLGDLRQCLRLVSEHAEALEAAIVAGTSPVSGHIPLAGALLSQASALQRCMMQCVADASRIRGVLHTVQRPHMDAVLAKMECELDRWTSFLSSATTALYNTTALMDNLHNLIAVQRRCVSEVSASEVFSAGNEAEAEEEPRTPVHRRAPSAACSTPIARD